MRSIALLVTVTAAGCGGGPETCLPDCPANRSYDAIAYDLRAELAWDDLELIAEEDITVLLGDAPPVIELDANVDVDEVTGGGDDLGYVADRERGKLRVDLTPLGTSGEVTFRVKYRAPASVALVFGGPRDDDPVWSRIAYSNSEPDRGRNWLVSNDHPSDRARFSVELSVDPDEDVIANGERLEDRVSGGKRIVKHGLAQPIPTYLMAFAAGHLEHTDRTDGRVPLSVWHRRDVPVDHDAFLAMLARQMDHFETLIGPYPWERYSVVLIPGFSGGMENATITFNSEASGVGAISETLNAHELAHQWFGDWVTMRDYRDVWFKEGMATLLAAEASRPVRDAEDRGRLFGAQFNFDPAAAIIDDELTGLARYTSGPYERAAWTMTQVRARIGEAAFWESLRKVLTDHALGTVDSDTFVRAFAPHLDAAGIQWWLNALPRKGAPRVNVTVAGANVAFAVQDPQGLLLDPIEVTVVDAAGGATVRELAPDQPLSIDVAAGGYVAPDERDLHPYWTPVFQTPQKETTDLNPKLSPTTPAALTAFASRSASAQERALLTGELAAFVPDSVDLLADALDSNLARRELLLDGCRRMAALPQGTLRTLWENAVLPLLAQPSAPGFSNAYAACGGPLLAELVQLGGLGGGLSGSQLARVDYLLGFDYGSANLGALAAIALDAPTVRHRDLALDRIAQQARQPYSGVAAADLPAFRQFFRERLADVSSAGRFLIVWRGILGVGAREALGDVGALLHSIRLDARTQRQVVCEAFQLTAGGAGWAEFQAAAQPWSTLSAEAAAALADPNTCL